MSHTQVEVEAMLLMCIIWRFFVKMQILAPLVWSEARDSAFQPHSLEMLAIGIARRWGELLERCFLMERPIG